MQQIDRAFAQWTRAHARLVQAERKWGAVVTTGSDEERRAVDREIRVLRVRSDTLLRRADEALANSDRPRT